MAEIKIKNTKIRYGNFPDCESFFADEHLKGHKFVRYEKKALKAGQFIFEECEPEDIVYRLDYGKNEYKESYTASFSDFGWEYVGTASDFHLFRKQRSNDMNDNLFSDNKSKAEMCKKVLERRSMVSIFSSMSLIMISQISSQDIVKASWFSTVVLLITIPVMLLAVIFVITLTADIIDLQTIVNKYENPLEAIEKKKDKKKKKSKKDKALDKI